MTQSDPPLPTPKRGRFGREAHEETGPGSSLVSDRMALAAAEGRLEEFLQHEIPQGDHARNLALMMMGMSGMLPPGQPAAAPATNPTQPQSDEQTATAPEVPPEVLAAIQQGDVENLKGLLQAEHARRGGREAAGEVQQSPDSPSAARPAEPPAAPSAAGPAGIDAAVIDELIRISSDNDVTVDWLMLRAVKLYVGEYRKTGRL